MNMCKKVIRVSALFSLIFFNSAFCVSSQNVYQDLFGCLPGGGAHENLDHKSVSLRCSLGVDLSQKIRDICLSCEDDDMYREMSIALQEQFMNGNMRSSLRNIFSSITTILENVEDVCAQNTLKELFEHKHIVDFVKTVKDLQEESIALEESVASAHDLRVYTKILEARRDASEGVQKFLSESIESLKNPANDNLFNMLKTTTLRADVVKNVAQEGLELLHRIESVINCPLDVSAIVEQLKKLQTMTPKCGNVEFARENARLVSLLTRDMFIPVMDEVIKVVNCDERLVSGCGEKLQNLRSRLGDACEKTSNASWFEGLDDTQKKQLEKFLPLFISGEIFTALFEDSAVKI
jgi:cell fate (sporulation/competence/biofilm development) regulator YmcA (YheA/YmcA/DUF963 family)